MRYTINGVPPYYPTLNEARKAAMMVDESEWEYHNGCPIMGIIKNDAGDVLGIVTKRVDLDGKFYFMDFKKQVSLEIEEDGSVPKIENGIVYTIDGEYVLKGNQGSVTFSNMDMLIKAFIHKTKNTPNLPPFSYQIVLKNGVEVAKLFFNEKGHYRMLKPNGKVYMISDNGKIGEIDKTLFFKDGSLCLVRPKLDAMKLEMQNQSKGDDN